MNRFSGKLPMPTTKRHPSVVGHRGGSGLAPENTLAAFQQAVALGIDGVEFDVQRSKDGQLVVFHDEDLARTTDISGKLYEKTLAELSQADTGSWFEPRYKGERIRTLGEVFDFMRGNDLLMFVELKEPAFYEGIETQVAQQIRASGMVERVQVRSFNHEALHRFHAIAPEISVSELWWKQLPAVEEVTYPTVDALFTNYTQENIAAYHAQGIKVTAWTVNDLDAARQLIAWGIDSMTTDYPDQLLALLAAPK